MRMFVRRLNSLAYVPRMMNGASRASWLVGSGDGRLALARRRFRKGACVLEIG